MGVSYNPKISTNGLVMYLDPANRKSYPGSGTTCYDLTGNGINGTLKNGVSFLSTTNGGVFACTAASLHYIEVLNLNYSASNYTLIGASRYTGTGARTFSALTNNWLMGHHAGTSGKAYSVGWFYQGGGDGTVWRVYASSGDIAGDKYSYYENGVALVTDNAGGTAGPNNLAINSYAGTSEFSDSHIGCVMMYNRVLTATEVAQNFMALRGRYGI